MDEYIKQEAAIEAVKHAWAKGLEPSQYIEIITAADVAPVRHGKWEVGYFHDRVCSCCLHPDNDFDDYAHKFCPHCGAKMDGGLTDGC